MRKLTVKWLGIEASLTRTPYSPAVFRARCLSDTHFSGKLARRFFFLLELRRNEWMQSIFLANYMTKIAAKSVIQCFVKKILFSILRRRKAADIAMTSHHARKRFSFGNDVAGARGVTPIELADKLLTSLGRHDYT